MWDTRLFPQCREVRKRNSSERCRFVRGTPDCRLDDGFLDYLGGAFCAFPAALLPLPVGLYVSAGAGGGGRAAPAGGCSATGDAAALCPQVLWLLYLFVILGVTAEKL